MVDDPAPILAVRGLVVEHRSGGRRPPTRVVDGVDLDLRAGRAHGLVGPSGAGKTSVIRAVAQLTRPSEGSVLLRGDDLVARSGRALRRARADLQVVFQDPGGTLDPRWSIGRSVAEPLRVGRRPRRTVPEAVAALLERVGLAAADARRYPHELSSGQRQRAAIARALAPQPAVVLCDEPLSALDASVQARVLALIRELRDERDLALLFVTHDLAVAAQLCDTISVMHHGRIVEHGSTPVVIGSPRHECTVALLDAAHRLDPG